MILLRLPLACLSGLMVLLLGLIASVWACLQAFHVTLAGGSVRDALSPKREARHKV